MHYSLAWLFINKFKDTVQFDDYEAETHASLYKSESKHSWIFWILFSSCSYLQLITILKNKRGLDVIMGEFFHEKWCVSIVTHFPSGSLLWCIAELCKDDLVVRTNNTNYWEKYRKKENWTILWFPLSIITAAYGLIGDGQSSCCHTFRAQSWIISPYHFPLLVYVLFKWICTWQKTHNFQILHFISTFSIHPSIHLSQRGNCSYP